MKRYRNYLWYVIRHKWYVMLECFKRGQFLLGILHDWSKFLPSEFFPYAKHFYNADGTKADNRRNKTGYYKPTNTGDPDFDRAWFYHQKRNKHHWQWSVMPEDEEGVVLLDMPLKYRIEMICDWFGASGAQKTTGSVQHWWNLNNHKMQLHPDVRQWVEENL